MFKNQKKKTKRIPKEFKVGMGVGLGATAGTIVAMKKRKEIKEFFQSKKFKKAMFQVGRIFKYVVFVSKQGFEQMVKKFF